MSEKHVNYQKILDLITKNNLAMNDVAKNCHLSSQTFYNIQKGSDIGVLKLVRIADYLGVSLDYLLDREDLSTQIGHQVRGNGNNVSGNIMLTECQRELQYLKSEIEHYKELLNEKERTIKILLESQEYFNKDVQR